MILPYGSKVYSSNTNTPVAELYLFNFCFPQVECPNAWHVRDALKIFTEYLWEERGREGREGRGYSLFPLVDQICWLNMSDDSWRDRYTHPSSTQENLDIKTRTKQLPPNIVWILMGKRKVGWWRWWYVQWVGKRNPKRGRDRLKNISSILLLKNVSIQIFKQ